MLFQLQQKMKEDRTTMKFDINTINYSNFVPATLVTLGSQRESRTPRARQAGVPLWHGITVQSPPSVGKG